MSRISNAHELRQEIVRLKALNKEQDAALRQQLEVVQESLKPHNLLRHAVKDIISNVTSDKSIYRSAISTGAELLVHHFAGKQAGGMAGKLSRIILGRLAAGIAASGYEVIADKIRSLFNASKKESGENRPVREENKVMSE